MPFFDTGDVGPIVIEIPPAAVGSITGSVDDGWQTALEDVGPAGVDKGKGGKYLILPPGYRPRSRRLIAMTSETYRATRCCAPTPRAPATRNRQGRLIRQAGEGYPLSQAESPPPTNSLMRSTRFDSTIPYDLRFFQALDRFVQHEPWMTGIAR